VEEKALEKEKDKQSKERLSEVQRELSELQDKLKPLQMRYRWGGRAGGWVAWSGAGESGDCRPGLACWVG